MTHLLRALRPLSVLLTLLLVLAPAVRAEQFVPEQFAVVPLPAPTTLAPSDPWLYRGSDIPPDEQWVFGELANGLRYAVRGNGVPPGQVSIRIRIDAGSLYETDSERGYAHLIEHLSFRESKYLENAQAIPTWQRLGASFGSDTNAETTPTHTVYKLDLPNATRLALEESVRLLSGMIREPALSAANLKAEVPIVLAELRENGGSARRVGDATRSVYFAGQLLADRSPIGTVETLEGATSDAVRAFHSRWYLPENTVIAISGDARPEILTALVERYFGDWEVAGKPTPAPDFGEPTAPEGADPANPVGETKVLVEPDLPRSITWATMRPWQKVTDNLEYNRGLMIGSVAQAIINRRLEAHARAGGSYLFAGVEQDDISRSVDGTFVSVVPLGEDWASALRDVRAVIADAIANPPTEEEIAREVAEIDVVFANLVEQRDLQAGAKLADDLVNAVDIGETVASPETILAVFRDMRDRFTPEAVLEHSRALFQGTVKRILFVTPRDGEAGEDALRLALLEPVEADSSARIAARSISFAELPPIGTPADPVVQAPVGIHEIVQSDFANGVHAMLWRTENEPGRVTVRVRFGSGYRAFSAEDAPYITLGQMALVGSGIGLLGEEELDRIATGRKLGFDFSVEDGAFVLDAQTRPADVADQLYLFAAKLAMPRWDANPVLRGKAAARLGYESYAANPMGVITRDLGFLLNDGDTRFGTPTPAAMDTATPEGFRAVWEPLLAQGPVEVMVFGDIDPDATLAALSRTFGALPPRTPIPDAALARGLSFPGPQDAPLVLHHRGDADQAAAVVAWPSGGGVDGISESRQLDILVEIFSNRLLEAMREKAGASYTPSVSSTWPVDLDSGGHILALAQIQPVEVPGFFAEADAIAADLAANGPTMDEIARVTEPFRQVLRRAMTGYTFWMGLIDGATTDPRRITKLQSLVSDYTETTPARMQQLARTYLGGRKGWRLAVIPEGQELAPERVPEQAPELAVQDPSVPAGR